MTPPKRSIGFARAGLLAAILCGVAGTPAAAYDARSGPVSVSVTATGGSGGVQTVRVHASTTEGSRLYEIRAHVCLPGRNVRTNFDFGFEGRACPNVAVGRGDVDPSAAFPNGVTSGTLENVRVGTGAAHWVNELGYPGSIRCDAAHACDLVVRVQVTNATVFVTVPLCNARPCHDASSRWSLATVWPWILAIAAVLVVAWIAVTRRRASKARVP